MSQLKAKSQSQGLPRCSPAATQVTIPTGNTPESASDPLLLELNKGKRTRTRDNHDPTNTLAGLQEQVSQLTARTPSRGLPRCPPATTQATILTGNTPEAASDPLPLKLDEGKRTRTKHNHDPGKFDPISGGGRVELTSPLA